MSVSTWSLQTHSDFSDLPDIQIVTNKYGYRFCYVTYQASHVYTANNRHCEHTHVLNKPHEERLFLLKKKKKGLLWDFFPWKNWYNCVRKIHLFRFGSYVSFTQNLDSGDVY